MAGKRRSSSRSPAETLRSGASAGTVLRIIGGKMRGRPLQYHGDPRTRPMKDRIREAAFNLIGPAVRDRRAIDLFAGTGALGLEAISRGASGATFIERHFPTARLIGDNARQLGVEDQIELVPGSAFVWVRRLQRGPAPQPPPWIIFCSPPYAFYRDKSSEMLQLIETLGVQAPAGSLMLVEADEQFDCTTLPEPEAWQVRTYAPAQLALREF